MIKNIIAIYPGRFQPFGKHHAAAFKWLQQQFGQANAYIVTSDKVDPPKSPFDFNEKKAIISQYGFTNIVQVKNPYKAEELMNDLNPSDTAVVFMVGEKDMQEDPRFKIGQKKDGSPSYFQVYKDNKSNLQGFDKHGYLVTAPHISIAIPGYGEMSGTELRNVLGTKTVARDEKKKIFKDVFGWYDEQTANMIFDKLEPLTESIFTKNWWSHVFESINTESVLTEETIYNKIKAKAKDIIKKVKQENSETKAAFLKLLKAAKGDLTLSDADKTEIGDQMKDVLKMLGLATIAIVPGGSIAAVLIKLFKQEHLITPSAFMAEASLKPNIWSDFNLASLSKEDMDIVWQMYSDTYAKAGLDFSANDVRELQTKYKAVYLKDIDNDTIADAFIIYKPTAFGNKISLLGTNNKKEAKKSMLAQLFKLLKTQGWFIEASMKMEDILSAKSDISAITNEKTIQAMVGAKGIEIVKNGYYKRKLSKVDKTIVKRLYGTPTTDSIQEGNIVPEYTITPGGLEEGKQVGLLYHYTSADGLKGILSSNRINASEEYYLGNDLYYISFTRNKNFHNKGYKFGVKTEYRITLDGNKLSNRYKIIPFAYKPGWNYEDNWEYNWLEDEHENVVRDFFNNTGDYDEQEERISFKSPKDGIDNIKDYILTVDKVEDLQEDRKKKSDPKTGTGEKPKGSGRRLYTDENPNDTVSTNIKTFATKQVEENLELATPSTLQSIANKHRISINHIKNQLQQGLRIEKERTKNVTDAIRIALQRIFKDPDYYVKLKILSLEDIESTVILPTVIEAIINNMVVCNGCGWTWKLSDGGKDPYLCHKCRTDNTPKSTSKSLDTNYISEVGEANIKPYKWKEVDREGYFIYTQFITDSETQYDVDLKSTNYIDDNLKNLRTIEIEFSAKPKGAEGGSAKIVVNKGELYKVMATVTDIVKTYIKKSKAQVIIYSPSKKSNEENFGIQRDNLYKAFINKAYPGTKFEKIRNLILATLPDAVTEGYMGVEQTKKHHAKLDKLKNFLNTNIGREFVYDFDMYPKTVVGVGVQESAKFIPSSLGKKLISDGGAAGHMAHPFNIDWVKNGKDLLEVFKMAVEYLKNGPGAVKIDGLNASIRLIELDGKKQFVLDRGSQKDLDIRGITKADLLDRFGDGHGMITIGGKVLDIFNDALNATSTDLKQLGLWNDPNLMFNLEYVSGTSNVIEYGNNFLAIHGLLEITRQPNAKTGKPGARVSKEVVYNEDVMQTYIDKLAVFAQKQGYEVVGSVPTELTSEPNFTKVLSEKVAINYGNGKTETKPLSQWLSTIKVPETQTIKLTNGKTVNALSKAVLNAVLEGIPLNEFVADVKDIPLAIDGAITYIATAKLGDEVLKNLDSKLGSVADHEGVVIRDERIYNKPFKLTGQFIITGQTSQFQK